MAEKKDGKIGKTKRGTDKTFKRQGLEGKK